MQKDGQILNGPIPVHEGPKFSMESLSDSGCMRTCIAKNVLQKYKIEYEQNKEGVRLQAANNSELKVNGVIILSGTYDGTKLTTLMHCLVTQDLDNEIIVSWFDAQRVGALNMHGVNLDRLSLCNKLSQSVSEEEFYIRCELNLIYQVTEICSLNGESSETTFQTDIALCATIKHSKQEDDNFKTIIQNLKNKFPCISDRLSKEPMKGTPMKIQLKKDYEKHMPIKCYTPASVGINQRKATDATIDEMIEDGIIKQLEHSEIPEFCSRGLFISKTPPEIKDQKFRFVVDFSGVNKCIERPIHPFFSGRDLLQQIPDGQKFFCKLDALSGFHQIDLHPDSRYITTFIIERGTFVYLRCPQGLNASGDEFIRRSDDAIKGCTGYKKLVDDILVWGSTLEELIKRVTDILNRCMEHNITISKKKLELGRKVGFAGFDVSDAGVTPTRERIKAILDIPSSAMKTMTGIRSFQGATQFLTDFVPDLAMKNIAIRQMLKEKSALVWEETQERCFEEVKKILTGPLIMGYYNPSFKTEVITDASKIGLGFILRQHDEKANRWRLIQCGSRAISDTESRYAVCELEGLGILFALRKCRHYLIGMTQFDVLTDHKSLVSVFKKDLCSTENVRLRRFLEKVQEFNFEVKYIKGSKNHIADMLSRHPVSPAEDSIEEEGEEEHCVCRTMTSPITQKTDEDCRGHVSICRDYIRMVKSKEEEPDPLLQKLIEAAEKDPEYQALIERLSKYMYKEEMEKSDPIRKIYGSLWRNLSRHPTGLVVHNNERILVPKSEREDLICEIHKPHTGINYSQRRARRDYIWPHLDNDIEIHVKQCDKCITHLASQPQEKLTQQNKATEPMEVVGADLFQWRGINHLVITDQFSGYIYVQRLGDQTTRQVKEAMGMFFNLFGNPLFVIQDNGTQLKSGEYKNFMEKRGIRISPRSPYFPQSNGLAESGVKIAKDLMEKVGGDWIKFDEALASRRDVPNATGYTPSEIFLARRSRVNLPILPGKTSLNTKAAELGAAARKEMREKEYNKRSFKNLRQLEVNEKVHVQSHIGRKRWSPKEATVTGIKPDGRGYYITMSNGFKTSRNRRHLRPALEKNTEDPDISFSDDPENDYIINRDHECDDTCDSEENDEGIQTEVQIEPESDTPAEQPAQPELRRSTRTNKGVKNHYCTGCCPVRTYLRKLNQLEPEEQKLDEIRRNNCPSSTQI